MVCELGELIMKPTVLQNDCEDSSTTGSGSRGDQTTSRQKWTRLRSKTPNMTFGLGKRLAMARRPACSLIIIPKGSPIKYPFQLLDTLVGENIGDGFVGCLGVASEDC